MRFANVRLDALTHVLPDEVVTSAALEERLAPVYGRLGLVPGRLEMLSGIRERRTWPAGTRPSEVAARAGQSALERSGVAPERIGSLVHAAVSRDFIEPATASFVHETLGLPAECQVFDLSNACLGFVNAMSVVASQIEAGAIDAGMVVAGEDATPVLEGTIEMLNTRADIGRRDIKEAYASLTCGSGAAAAVMTRADPAVPGQRFLGGVVLAATEHSGLCSGDKTGDGSKQLMRTNSEGLLVEGTALADRTWRRFTEELGWTGETTDRFVTHQVAVTHKKVLFETLGLDHAKDHPTVERLGNTGAVALPTAFSLAVEEGFISSGHKVAMLAMGSGLNCIMAGVEW